MEDCAPLQLSSESAAEFPIAVDLLLRLDRFVAEHRLHRVHAGEQKGIAQIKFDYQRTCGNLRAASALQQRRDALKGLGPGLRRVIAVAKIEPGDRPTAFRRKQ